MNTPNPSPHHTPSSTLLRTWVGLLLATGCGNTAFDVFETCSIQVALDRTEGAPGAIVTAAGGPFSEPRDTRVELGGEPVTVLAIEQADGEEDRTEACDACALCREEASCGPCGSCPGRGMEPARRRECFGDDSEATFVPGSCDLCVEQMTLEIPTHPSGPTHMWIVNRFGTSELVPFTVLSPDTGDTNTGNTNTGDTNTGDTNTGDTNTGDTSDTSDTGSTNTGGAGSTNAGGATP